jgi:hypothetical protein
LGWATFWAIFSQTHPVTLLPTVPRPECHAVPEICVPRRQQIFFVAGFNSILVVGLVSSDTDFLQFGERRKKMGVWLKVVAVLSALLVLAFSANGSMPFHIVFKYATER